MPITKDIEQDDKTEAKVVKDFLHQIDEQVRKTIGANYRFTMVFVSEDQCQEFLQKTGWDKYKSKDSPFVDGLAVAEELGISLEVAHITFREEKPDHNLISQVGIIPEGAKT